MKPYRYTLVSAFILFLSFGLHRIAAQSNPVQFLIKNETVLAGDILEADVQVLNFNRIVGASLTVRWDSMHLRFAGLSNLALGISGENNNFGLTQVSSGVLPFLLIDNALEGFTLPDSAILFTVRLEAIAEPVVETTVSFSSIPTPQEVSDTTFEAIEALYFDGNITIEMVTDAQDIAVQPLQLLGASPNPLTQETWVNWRQSTAAKASLSLYDVNGKLITQWEKDGVSGDNKYRLGRELFPQAGSYYLHLRTGDQVQTLRLIVL
jgi:hypothetical protein